MWVGKGVQAIIDALQTQLGSWQAGFAAANSQLQQVQLENTRLRSDLDWFKHRLNQVEKERGQLIQAAIGVKVAVPEFVPAYNPEDALNAMPDLSTVGNDAKEQIEHEHGFKFGEEQSGVMSYTNLPGYKPLN